MPEQPLNDLLARGGGALGPPLSAGDLENVPEPLRPLLSLRNGCYAFGPSLFIRPWGPVARGSGPWWNAEDTWRHEYQGAGDDLLFFAEDILGFQYALHRSGFYAFDPETAERERVAADVEGWARAILADVDHRTGAPLAEAWTERRGPVPPGSRLAPVVPFFLGGAYDLDQINVVRDVELMRFRGDVYRQTRDLPEGAQIELRF